MKAAPSSRSTVSLTHLTRVSRARKRMSASATRVNPRGAVESASMNGKVMRGRPSERPNGKPFRLSKAYSRYSSVAARSSCAQSQAVIRSATGTRSSVADGMMSSRLASSWCKAFQ